LGWQNDAVQVCVIRGAGEGRRAQERRCALRALGCAAASIWRGQCDMNGQDRGQLLQGIGSRCRGGSGGEVTGRGVDGGLLAELGCSRWPWLLAGQRGVLLACLCGVGSWWGPREGGDHLLGVRGGGLVDDQRERERCWQRWPRAPPSPRCQPKKDKKKSFLNLLDIQRKIPSRSPFPLLGRLRRREREREKDGLGARVCITEIQI
jgi:hypothetical protein